MMYEFRNVRAGEGFYLLTRRMARNHYEWQLYSTSFGREDYMERFGMGFSRQDCIDQAQAHLKRRLGQ